MRMMTRWLTPALVALAALGLALPTPGSAALRQDDIDLSTSVKALHESHPAAVNQLPGAQKAQDPLALAVVDQLPKVVQESYLITLQDYPNLDPATQKRVNSLIDALALLQPARTKLFVAAVTREFGAVEKDPKKLAAARQKPHDVALALAGILRRARPARGAGGQ